MGNKHSLNVSRETIMTDTELEKLHTQLDEELPWWQLFVFAYRYKNLRALARYLIRELQDEKKGVWKGKDVE